MALTAGSHAPACCFSFLIMQAFNSVDNRPVQFRSELLKHSVIQGASFSTHAPMHTRVESMLLQGRTPLVVQMGHTRSPGFCCGVSSNNPAATKCVSMSCSMESVACCTLIPRPSMTAHFSSRWNTPSVTCTSLQIHNARQDVQ